MIEEHVSLAFALRSNPGAYALLLGAGVSASAGVPSAWGVQEALIQRIAGISGDHPEDAFAWYETEYGRPSSYSELLGSLAKSQAERQMLLRQFFQPTDEERVAGRKLPTVAHQAVARLVSSGLVRVVLTTNFDRLLESALRAAAIEPTVVAVPGDIDGLNSLHTIPCLVIHLHGDYLNPTGMLNTTEELAGYPTNLNSLLDKVLDDYGLVIAGWAATWDDALRDAISRCPSRRFTTYWVDPYPLSSIADDLRIRRHANLVVRTADDFFGRLADACDALADVDRTHPASVAVAVASAKRSLSGSRRAVDLHDLLREQVEKVRNLPSITPSSFHGEDENEYANRLERLEAGIELLLALVATLAYWGDDSTDRWWFDDISRFADAPHVSGMASLINLTRAPATQVLYAAGTAASAADRWQLVAQLLTEPATTDSSGRRVPVALFLSPRYVMSTGGASRRLHNLLRPLLVEHLSLGSAAFIDAWEHFEYLRLVGAADNRLINKQSFGADMPHIRAVDGEKEYQPAVSDWLRAQVDRYGKEHPLLVAGFCGGDPDRLRAAQSEYDEQFRSLAHEVAWRSLPTGGGILQSGTLVPGRGVLTAAFRWPHG